MLIVEGRLIEGWEKQVGGDTCDGIVGGERGGGVASGDASHADKGALTMLPGCISGVTAVHDLIEGVQAIEAGVATNVEVEARVGKMD